MLTDDLNHPQNLNWSSLRTEYIAVCGWGARDGADGRGRTVLSPIGGEQSPDARPSRLWAALRDATVQVELTDHRYKTTEKKLDIPILKSKSYVSNPASSKSYRYLVVGFALSAFVLQVVDARVCLR